LHQQANRDVIPARDLGEKQLAFFERVCLFEGRLRDFAFSLRAGFLSMSLRSTPRSKIARKYIITLESNERLESRSTYFVNQPLQLRVHQFPDLSPAQLPDKVSLD
jgi:hypothetical protein